MLKDLPYWWEDAPLANLPPAPVLPKSDVVIVGAGYTGLSAALTLARAGRSVQVFDRMRPGEGASTRNAGMASGNLALSFGELARKFGEERAKAIQVEARAAREYLASFIRDEGIDCDFAMTGRFTGATSPADYDKLARDAERTQKTIGIEIYAIPRREQRSILGTDFYHGGVVRFDI